MRTDRKHMSVYVNNRLTIIETNIATGILYWTKRQRVRKLDNVRIHWEIR